MSYLYPRLLHAQAKTMAAEYRGLPIEELTARSETAHDAAVYVATGGDRALDGELKELRRLVVAVAEERGFPHPPAQADKSSFDHRLAIILHSGMGLVPAEAASGDVWAFLALVLLPDVAHWRYPDPPGDRVLRSDLTRHVFGRLWWRAQLIHSPEKADPYADWSVLGEAAFDQIYARRAALGGSPQLVKSILRVWNDLALDGLPQRGTLQDFLKRLLRLAPFVLFEALEPAELDAELKVVARETATAMLLASGLSEADIPARLDRIFPHSEAPDDVSPVLDRLVPIQEGAEGVQAYKAYDGPSFGDPRDIGLQSVAEAVVAVVTTEGPVSAERVFRVVTTLGEVDPPEDARKALIDASKYAKRVGLIEVEGRMNQSGHSFAVLRLPEQPPYLLRERGPREPAEIPPREISAAARLVRSADPHLDDVETLGRVVGLFGGEDHVRGLEKAVAEVLAADQEGDSVGAPV